MRYQGDLVFADGSKLPNGFWRNVEMPASGVTCWIWKGPLSVYGYAHYGGPPVAAHRIAFKALRGEIPSELVIDHDDWLARWTAARAALAPTGAQGTAKTPPGAAD